LKNNLKRVYHHYERCEEYKSAMWTVIPIEQREALILQSAALLSDVPAFELAMLLMVKAWPNSCEANLTPMVINHRAWMGQAACAFNHGASEDLTKLAWGRLSFIQQELANDAADRVINAWRENYVQSLKNKQK
jgi:hypothetical protein